MIQQGRPKQLVDQLSPHRCREWHGDQTSASDCLRLRLMPSLEDKNKDLYFQDNISINGILNHYP
ncbi:hypothetical protein MtrunA17_Chr7g0272121 [Medicago truncatula]|uniref:Uncharacterized protein n=1 Tax=Medicago truncatula TaxID=3880 RepID=A0A396H914_MEDTR|nr:hypothetical protein MtrunA17_Chr7g0272121 [Medicago truncatula]